MLEGPRWYRSRIRTLGALAGLLAPAVMGAIAILSLRLFDGPVSGTIGLVGGVFAAPALLIVGAPFGDNDIYPIAVGASAILWLLTGYLAARRATRHPFATWNDYWRHYAWLCGGIWLGSAAALGIAAWSISDSLV